jgi:hypothetical protein
VKAQGSPSPRVTACGHRKQLQGRRSRDRQLMAGPKFTGHPYVCETLENRSSQIRLLTLLPSYSWAPIRGSLTIVNLGPTIQEYEALSYDKHASISDHAVPGQQYACSKVLVRINKRTLSIVPVLAQALRLSGFIRSREGYGSMLHGSTKMTRET